MTDAGTAMKKGGCRPPKFTQADCTAILWLWKNDKRASTTALARRFQTTPTTISRILDGRYNTLDAWMAERGYGPDWLATFRPDKLTEAAE